MYTVMKNNDKVLYFEVVNNKYVQPISSFNLYDNEGKSLTSVNEHFFMNQLVNRINVACKKGIFISDQEIVDFLNKVKASCEDLELKKLFKGSYMTEINEFNFENNKRNIVRYLDKFKFDTFVDYNNVSVFSGSLEKSPSVASVETAPVPQVNEVASNDQQLNLNNVVEQGISNNDVQNVENTEVVDVVEEPAINNDDSSVQQSNNSMELDFMNVPVDNSTGDVISSSDYFSNNQVASNNEQPSVSSQTESLDFNSLYGNPVQEQPVQENITVQEVESSPVQEVVQEVEPIPVQEIVQPVVDQPMVEVSQENSALQPASSPVDLTAPLDFNALYGNKESAPAPDVQPVADQPVEVSQENPALQPATSPVDLTKPLDFNALYSNNEGASVQNVVQENPAQASIQMIPNSSFSTPVIDSSVSLAPAADISPSVPVDDNQSQPDPFNQEVADSNQSVDENAFPNDGFSLAEPLMENVTETSNYVGEVKERLENGNLGVMNPNVTESDLEKTVVVDKVNMPPLESIPDETPKKSKKKGSIGVIIFIIVLLLVLAGFAYFLYNYIF